MAAEWRSIDDDVPDWRDGGPTEIQFADGRVVAGCLTADEFWTGEDEIPVWTFTADDGSPVDIFSAERWRPVRRTG